jgi:hypothetical protein
MESAAEIDSKLSIYQSQLEQVNQLLTVEPTNDQFLNLKDDLEKVISLTETLLSQYYPDYQRSATESSANRQGNTKSDEDDDDDDKYSLGDLEEEGDDSTEDKAIASVLLSPKTGPFQVNDRVEVTGGARPFAGVITEVIGASESKIRYYEFPDDLVSLPLSSLTRISPGPYNLSHIEAHNPHLAVGMKCQGKYGADQQFYDVTIAEKTSHGYKITYESYGTTEEVPLEYLRPRPKLTLQKKTTETTVSSSQPNTMANSINNLHQTGGFSSSKGTTTAAKGSTAADKSNVIPIPANLQILPTDTEEEKKRKQKKIKAIKNKNRLITQEEDVKHVQQNWKSFVDKVRLCFFSD